MEEKVKEIVEIKQRSLAEENQKTLEVLKERYLILLMLHQVVMFILLTSGKVDDIASALWDI